MVGAERHDRARPPSAPRSRGGRSPGASCPAPRPRRRTPRTRPAAAPGVSGRRPPSTAEVTSFAPKEWPMRCSRGARSPRAVTAGASSSRPSRSPTCPARRFMSQKLSACSGESAQPPRRAPSRDLAHERVQLELVLGAQRHLGLAERREQPARACPARRRASSPEAARASSGSASVASCQALGRRHPRRASTASGSPARSGTTRSPSGRSAVSRCAKNRCGALARLGLIVQPAVAEDEAVRGGAAGAPGAASNGRGLASRPSRVSASSSTSSRGAHRLRAPPRAAPGRSAPGAE